MSKIGKKYRIASTDAISGSLSARFKSLKDNGVGVDIQETFKTQPSAQNDIENFFDIKIIFSNTYDNFNIYLNELVGLYPEFYTGFKDINFALESHYEELVEMKGLTQLDQATKQQIPSSIKNEILKFKAPLEYNFLSKNYENYLNNSSSIPENRLPFFYDVLGDFIGPNTYPFKGTSFFEDPQRIFNILNTYPQDNFKRNLIPTVVTIDGKEIEINKYLEKLNPFKEQFPFYTDITFDAHEVKKASLINKFRDIEFNDLALIDQVFQLLNSFSETAFNYQINGTYDSGSIYYNEGNIYDLRNSQEQTNFQLVKTKTFSLSDAFSFVLRFYTANIKVFDINEFILKNVRTFKDVLDGKPEYLEIIGYRLAKYKGTTNQLLQEWYLPNLGQEKINFIDSQVKYGKEYTYKLDPIILSFTSVYYLKDRNNPYRLVDNGKYELYLRRDIDTRIYILENAVQTGENIGPAYTNTLLDLPPIEPEVELVPFVGVDNKIKIILNTAIGRKTVPAVDFSPEEDAKKDVLRKSQNMDTESALLTFQADEPNERFEIYRLTKKPKAYSDFFNNLLTTVYTNNASSAAYLDTVEPNTKYYYIARGIDFHGNSSNPTSVYELEIVNDNGLIIPRINIVEFEIEKKDNQLLKSFKKYLKIQPAPRHRIINEEITTKTDIQLGKDQENPWSSVSSNGSTTKRFKLRVTSKSSGKKIDINFSFKYNKPQ